MAIRVPTSVVSISDVTMLLKKDTTAENINTVVKKVCADPYYQGILSCNEQPLVSSDFIGNSHSGIVDLPTTKVLLTLRFTVRFFRLSRLWQSSRLVELVADIGKTLG